MPGFQTIRDIKDRAAARSAGLGVSTRLSQQIRCFLSPSAVDWGYVVLEGAFLRTKAVVDFFCGLHQIRADRLRRKCSGRAL
ncbi:hypothetical protein FRC0088_01984 [Corynebacterium diphtheriae]|nr:hypothetical protein FRC0088_01984 [Corynebacterium diphtheriae]